MNNLGPQKALPVLESILNHQGKNWVALTLRALDAGGARLDDFSLRANALVQSGYGDIPASPQPVWTKRLNAY